jgi:hypothetical protein
MPENISVYLLGGTYKVVTTRELGNRNAGLQTVPEAAEEFESVADGRFASSLARTKSTVRELALCNDWDCWVTLTLNSENIDRTDLKGFIKALGEWIGNYNKKYKTKLKYLLLPELHKDGVSWHMHGFFGGVSPESITRNEHRYFDMPYFVNRFGYISIDRIRDKKRISSYIVKYVKKAVGATILEKSLHSYYASNGLKHKELLLETLAYTDIEYNPDFFCGVAYYDSLKELQNHVKFFLDDDFDTMCQSFQTELEIKEKQKLQREADEKQREIDEFQATIAKVRKMLNKKRAEKLELDYQRKYKQETLTL